MEFVFGNPSDCRPIQESLEVCEVDNRPIISQTTPSSETFSKVFEEAKKTALQGRFFILLNFLNLLTLLTLLTLLKLPCLIFLFYHTLGNADEKQIYDERRATVAHKGQSDTGDGQKSNVRTHIDDELSKK